MLVLGIHGVRGPTSPLMLDGGQLGELMNLIAGIWKGLANRFLHYFKRLDFDWNSL
jgi:hypothetical protein